MVEGVLFSSSSQRSQLHTPVLVTNAVVFSSSSRSVVSGAAAGPHLEVDDPHGKGGNAVAGCLTLSE